MASRSLVDDTFAAALSVHRLFAASGQIWPLRRHIWLQLRAFVGQSASSMTTPTRRGVSNRLANAGPSVVGATLTVARNVSRRLSVKETHADAQSPPTKGYGWDQQKVEFVITKICWEIGNSFSPLEFRRWMKTHKDSETRLANMFNLSAWCAAPYNRLPSFCPCRPMFGQALSNDS